jgi:AbrB family looped-hinge helix DNA binding protein
MVADGTPGSTTATVGQRGTLVIPKALRERLGLREGDLVVMDVDAGGALRVRRAVAVPVEVYTPERKAEFLLNNAVDAADYERAVRAVRALGIDPATVAHTPPVGGGGAPGAGAGAT